MHWLLYGGGVNSTALAVILLSGQFPRWAPFRILFADTGDERDYTYIYIRDHFQPYLYRHGVRLEFTRAKETVLQRWRRLKLIGSRRYRSCTDHCKIRPVKRYIETHGGGIQMVGIDAGEPERIRPSSGAIYPLYELGINRAMCEKIIIDAGLPNPGKSGCWHCPFLSVQDVLELARTQPMRFSQIDALEKAATAAKGEQRWQWGKYPCGYWRERAFGEKKGHCDLEIAMPCECYDG